MLKVCYGCESNFPPEVFEKEIKKIDTNSYLYSFNSTGNNQAKCLATKRDFRVIMYDCSDRNKISGIIQILNICDIVVLFYDEIQYNTGFDLITKCCHAYKIPIKVVHSNGDTKKFNSYPKPSGKMREIDYRKINYNREENINDTYDRREALFKLMTNYDRISGKKKSRQIILI